MFAKQSHIEVDNRASSGKRNEALSDTDATAAAAASPTAGKAVENEPEQ